MEKNSHRFFLKLVLPYLVLFSALCLHRWGVLCRNFIQKVYHDPFAYEQIYKAVAPELQTLQLLSLLHIFHWICKIDQGAYKEQRPKFRKALFANFAVTLVFAYSFFAQSEGTKWTVLYAGVRCVEAPMSWGLYFFKLLHRRFVNFAYTYNVLLIFWLPLQYIVIYTIIFTNFSNEDLEITVAELAKFKFSYSLFALLFTAFSIPGRMGSFLVFMSRMLDVITEKDKINEYKLHQ